MAANKISIRPGATVAQGDDLARNMRAVDVAECYAGAMMSPHEAVLASCNTSVAHWTATTGGRVICMFGISRLTVLSDIGVPWMLGTPLIDDYTIKTARASREIFARMRRVFPVMENHVDARNKTTLAWRRWLGFCIEPAAPYGPLGRPFHRFHT